MGKLHIIWDYFIRAKAPGNIPGSTNRTDHEARCKNCVEDFVAALRQTELERQGVEDNFTARTEDDIRAESKYIIY